jgi:hypothetical protein
MKKVTWLLVAVLFMSLSSLGQKLPIGSKAELRIWALEQSKAVSVSVGAQLPAGTNSYKYVQLESSTVNGISNTVLKTKLSLDATDPKDPCYMQVCVYGSNGFPLFSGMNQFYLVENKGSYTLPPGYGDVTLSLCDNITLPIDGQAQWAEAAFTGSDGKICNFSGLQIWNGKPVFSWKLAGTNAFLVVGMSDGSIRYWNVSNGQTIVPQTLDVVPATIITGIIPMTDGNVVVNIPTTNGIGQNQSVEYTSTKNQLVALSFYTSEGKWAKAVKIRKSGSNDWTTYSMVLDSTGKYYYVNLQFGVGVYYAVPVLDPADLTELADPWYPPYIYGDGEKG